MQLSIAFAVLLAYVLYSTPSNAVPTSLHYRTQESPKMITLPLKRLHVLGSGSDTHPSLLLQQHINRGNKRIARMTGRPEPTKNELRAEIQKRMDLLERELTTSSPTGSHFSRRYYRLSQNNVDAVIATSTTNTLSASGVSATGVSATGVSTTGVSASGVSAIDIAAAEKGGLTSGKAPAYNNSLALNIEADDVGYIATIQIGTPPQNFNILMDSGSADFWVGSETCRSQQGTCGNHTFLGSQSSSSFVQSSKSFNVTYGSGAVVGVLCQDNVTIASFQLNNHTFGVATQESIQFSASTVAFDGLMGLAQSKLSQQKVQTPVEAMASAGLIVSAISSFKISRLADQLNDGEVTFGGLDPTKYNASTLVSMENLSPVGFWEAPVKKVTVNGQDSGLSGRTAILDTGTTLIIAPPNDTQTIMSMLGGKCDSQQCTIPCTSNASVALSFGNASFAIDPRDMKILPVDPNNPNGDCTAGIQAGTVGTNTEWLVGDVFLKNAYFSVNTEKNQISLAKLL